MDQPLTLALVNLLDFSFRHCQPYRDADGKLQLTYPGDFRIMAHKVLTQMQEEYEGATGRRDRGRTQAMSVLSGD
jgi:hypothetical protein